MIISNIFIDPVLPGRGPEGDDSVRECYCECSCSCVGQGEATALGTGIDNFLPVGKGNLAKTPVPKPPDPMT